MRNRLILSFIAAASLVAASAQGGVLTSATWSASLQSNDFTVSNANGSCSESSPVVVLNDTSLGGQPCPTAANAAITLGATGSATATSYNVSLTMPLFSIEQFTTGGAVPIYTKASIVGPGAIQGTAAMATGITNVGGMVSVKLAAHVMGSAYAAGGAGSTLVKLPLSAGKAGTAYQYFKVLTNPHYLTVDFYAWTPGTKTFAGLTSKYAPLADPTVVAMGSFNLTANGGGTVTLVAPSKISIDGMLAQRRTASFTTLKLTYAPSVPEPATLLLLGAGVLGLAIVGSRKRQ